MTGSRDLLTNYCTNKSISLKYFKRYDGKPSDRNGYKIKFNKSKKTEI